MEYISFILSILFVLVFVLLGIVVRYSMNIHIEVSWIQFLEIVAQDPQATILIGKTSSGRAAHATFINGVWYACFEKITQVDRIALIESRILIVKGIYGL